MTIGRHFSTFHPAALLAMIAACSVAASAQCTNSAIPGKFYEYYIVAETPSCNGSSFTSLGSNPAINDFAQVGFVADVPSLLGTAIFIADGHMHPAVNPINPGETGSSEIYDGAVQINSPYPGEVNLVSKDSITTTSPATTSIRTWNTSTPDDYLYIARGGEDEKFGAVFPFPSINAKGDVALIALDAENPGIKYLVQGIVGGQVVQTVKAEVTVSVGEPMIDDDSDILLYELSGEAPCPPLVNGIALYQNKLTACTIIASSPNFYPVDSAPGISRDGMVIAFQGTLSADIAASYGTTPGPGIFAATNEGAGVWHIARLTNIQVETPNTGGNNNGICDPGETCQPGAELGYDAAGNAIYFNPTGYGVASRVAVTNLGLGATGIDDDSFVVSFVGTPTEASRPNPVLKNGTPLFFSANQGIWTIRVDVEHDLSSSSTRVYHPRTAIPVVQIGDRIGQHLVASLSAYDDLANAAYDETGAVRTMRRGDHRVAFWATDSAGQQFIARANHLDSDQDGLLDHWETTGIDMDQDGLVDLNLAAMGANVNARDLFLEIDWIADQTGLPYSFQPAPGVISAAPGEGTISPLVNMFDKAPSLNGDLYGVRIDGKAPDAIPEGIALHVDGGSHNDKAGAPFSVNMGTGPLEGGGKIGLNGNSPTGLAEIIYSGQPDSVTIPGISTRAFQDVKDNYFGAEDKDGRELAFRYAVFGDYFNAYKDTAGRYSWQVASATANTLTSASFLPTLGTFGGAAGGGELVKITGGKGEGQYATIKDVLNSDEVQLNGKWTTIPDSTSTFSIMTTSTGFGEIFINPGPDYNSLPGNDLILTFGVNAIAPYKTPNGLLGTSCAQWRTLAHELGHTLGLRHGGIDNTDNKGTAYMSLMSYSWQLQCDAVSMVQGYSGLTDSTFNDWANLQHNFPDSQMHLGNTQALAFGTFPEVDQDSPEQNMADYVAQNGPIDSTPPVVAVTSPAAGVSEGLTLPLHVTVTATDNDAVASVSVLFDVNGNGKVDPGELVVAKSSGANTYTANFPALSGPAGARTILASAIDTTGNSASATVSVNVQQPNPVPSLTTLVPPKATHGGAAFTLTVNGSNFVSGCTVQWNGAGRSTTFVNSGQVTAKILASDIAAAGSASVTVKNPTPGGGASNALTFTIQ